MRVQVVDPSAYTPPYDRALCAALARAGADVELVTSRFAYGDVPSADGYRVNELFYRQAGRFAAGGRARFPTKLAEHVPDMLRYRRHAREADVVHWQWLTVQPVDTFLLPPVWLANVANFLLNLILPSPDLLPFEGTNPIPRVILTPLVRVLAENSSTSDSASELSSRGTKPFS